ncbi:MAG: response regulator [Gammaproteobacteria bacterium]
MNDEPGQPSAATVYVVDDDRGVLKAMERLLRAAGHTVRTFDAPGDFLAELTPDMAGCLILDVKMPDIDGMQLQQALAERDCALPIIFLSGHGDIPTSVRAVKLGASDFLSKPADAATLLGAVDVALSQNVDERRARAERAREQALYETLTPREREVMRLVAQGLLNKQVAGELGTVEKTVKVHRARVMQKLKVRSVADLVRLVERNGWTKV